MAKITTLEGMRNYCKLMLGMPVINVECDDSQFNQIIEDSIQDFQRYNYDEGSYMDYIIFTASAGVDEYPASAHPDLAEIKSVYDLSLAFGLDGINTLFSPTHLLLYDQYVNRGNYPGGPGTGTGSFPANTGMVLAGYQIAMMYLDEIKNSFAKMYHADWLPGREVLRIVPTPSTTVTGLLIVYKREYATHLYNHPLVKKLCVARCRIQMGWHLNKYGATLPDGISINAGEMVAKGEKDEETTMENIRLESSPIDFYIA